MSCPLFNVYATSNNLRLIKLYTLHNHRKCYMHLVIIGILIGLAVQRGVKLDVMVCPRSWTGSQDCRTYITCGPVVKTNREAESVYTKAETVFHMARGLACIIGVAAQKKKKEKVHNVARLCFLHIPSLVYGCFTQTSAGAS